MALKEPAEKQSKFSRWLHPKFSHESELFNCITPDIVTNESSLASAYEHPATRSVEPVIWLPRDNSGVSQRQIADLGRQGIQATDEHAWLDENQKLVWRSTKEDNEPVYAPDYNRVDLI